MTLYASANHKLLAFFFSNTLKKYAQLSRDDLTKLSNQLKLFSN